MQNKTEVVGTEWTVWVSGMPHRMETDELPLSVVLHNVRKAFHPMPALYQEGDKHPLDIFVKPFDSDWSPWLQEGDEIPDEMM